jgi:hypothetical protein
MASSSGCRHEKTGALLAGDVFVRTTALPTLNVELQHHTLERLTHLGRVR